MSKETEHLKLFKYDPETDDFNTTTFNIKQCLNDNWDKIDLHLNDTQESIDEINLKDEEREKILNKLMSRLTFMTCVRADKQSGYYRNVTWKRKDGTQFARSTLSGDTTSNGDFTPKNMGFSFYDNQGSVVIEHYSFNLIFDSESGDLTEMRLM